MFIFKAESFTTAIDPIYTKQPALSIYINAECTEGYTAVLIKDGSLSVYGLNDLKKEINIGVNGDLTIFRVLQDFPNLYFKSLVTTLLPFSYIISIFRLASGVDISLPTKADNVCTIETIAKLSQEFYKFLTSCFKYLRIDIPTAEVALEDFQEIRYGDFTDKLIANVPGNKVLTISDRNYNIALKTRSNEDIATITLFGVDCRFLNMIGTYLRVYGLDLQDYLPLAIFIGYVHLLSKYKIYNSTSNFKSLYEHLRNNVKLT